MILYKSKLKEFVVQEISWLKQYLNQSDDSKAEEILYSFPYVIDYYTDDIVFEARRNDDDEMLTLIEDMEWEGVVAHLLGEGKYKEVSKEIKKKALEKLRHFDLEDEEIPSWFYLDRPTIIKNQWLIHFTDEADSLADEGFNYLVDDVTKLGLTTYINKKSYDRSKAGYGFSYLIGDYIKYGRQRSGGISRRGGWRYGAEVVLFRASGVRCWHNSDKEYQTIFKGDTVKEIIPITKGEDEVGFAVYNKKTRNQIFGNDDLTIVVDWVLNNYDQYRGVL